MEKFGKKRETGNSKAFCFIRKPKKWKIKVLHQNSITFYTYFRKTEGLKWTLFCLFAGSFILLRRNHQKYCIKMTIQLSDIIAKHWQQQLTLVKCKQAFRVILRYFPEEKKLLLTGMSLQSLQECVVMPTLK